MLGEKKYKKRMTIAGYVTATILLVLVLSVMLFFYFGKEKIAKTLAPVSVSVEPYEGALGQMKLDDPTVINVNGSCIYDIVFTRQEFQIGVSFKIANNEYDKTANFDYIPINLYNSNNLCIGRFLIPVDIEIEGGDTVTINGTITEDALAAKSSLLEIASVEFCNYIIEEKQENEHNHDSAISAINVDVDSIADVNIPFSYTVSNLFSIEELKNKVNIKTDYEYYTLQLSSDGDIITYGERNYGITDTYGGYIALNLYNEEQEFIGKVYDAKLEGTILSAQSIAEAEIELSAEHFIKGYFTPDIAYVKLALLFDE